MKVEFPDGFFAFVLDESEEEKLQRFNWFCYDHNVCGQPKR